MEELRLRQTLGQVSQQTVAQLEQTRVETVSQLNSLDATIRELKVQLQNLIGEAPTGELELGALPTRSETVWEVPDYEAGLEAAKAASWTLRSAQKALEDAEEDWKDARSDYRSSRKQYLLQQAEHTWNAAQLTYQSTVQNFETSFKSLYDSLANYEQLYASAQSALVWQQSQLDTVQTRYDLGLTTCSAVLDAGRSGICPICPGQRLEGPVLRLQQLSLGGGVRPAPGPGSINRDTQGGPCRLPAV